MINLILFGSFFVMLLLNIPIAVSLGMSSIFALLFSSSPLTVVPTNVYSGMAKFLLLAIPVAYLFLCALFSLGKYKNPYPAAAVQHRFLVLFTVLRNGKEVIESVNRFLDTQQYPRDKYDVAVAATQLPEEDLVTLLQICLLYTSPSPRDRG